MFNQIEDMLINTLVQKLNSHGINLDVETVKKALTNSPQVVQQIESILVSSTPEERLEKIKTIINNAAGTETSTDTKTTTTDAKG